MAFIVGGGGRAGQIIFLQRALPPVVAEYAMEEATMNEEIGTIAGSIWNVLHARGELSMTQLKKETGAKSPLFDWAVGWLAREGNIAILRDKKAFRVRLK